MGCVTGNSSWTSSFGRAELYPTYPIAMG